MSRKRGGKYKSYTNVKKIIEKKHKVNNTHIKTGLVLVGIFFMVLFLNSYFNYTSGINYNEEGTTLGTRFYLSGPDPYYNMRTCQVMMEEGRYPFIQSVEGDPLLNYPIHNKWSRPPLFNTITVAVATGLSNFMESMDALGWAMLWLPAIYGAFLIFPVYGIGKELFNKKIALFAAMLVPIIPIHIGSGHGSAFGLFDHDSFLSLLFVTLFFLIIKSLKEKDKTKSALYCILAGVSVSGIYITWAASRFVFMLLIVYIMVQLLFDIFKNDLDNMRATKMSLILFTCFGVTLPYAYLTSNVYGFPLLAMFFATGVSGLYMILNKIKMPWTLTLPGLGLLFGGVIGILYLVYIQIINLGGAVNQVVSFLFGEGIYGTEISWTIAEAGDFGISQTVMSFGPAIYWLGLAGFVLFVFKTFKTKWKPECLFFIVVFLIDFWLTTTAGRFMNDLIPGMVVFTAFLTITIIDKINYPSMMKSIKRIGGFRGIYKATKIYHVLGILFVVFLIFIPNSFLALDAAVPAEKKSDIFGPEYRGVWGESLGKSYYWGDALYWLSQQDNEIEKPEDRPAILTWWDYGFYISAMGEHPTVADNYQSGIPPASNFHTSKTEQEAVSVLIIRCLEGYMRNRNNQFGQELVDIVEKYFDGNTTAERCEILYYIQGSEIPPSYNTLVAPEYGNTQLKTNIDNAIYHDCIKIITENLTDEQITNLYMDVKAVTGYDIRYYGVEQYDTHIFGVFSFLSDRGVHGFITQEDDYFETKFRDRETGNEYSQEELDVMSMSQLNDLNLYPTTRKKDGWFDNMFYKVYYGPYEGNQEATSNRLPTYLLKHFKPAYISPYVVISKYYEGAKVTGSAFVDNIEYNGAVVYVFDDYGIPHDYDMIEQGEFQVIVPAGNITLELYMQGYPLNQTRKFNITENQGIRREPFNDSFIFNVPFANVTVGLTSNQTNLTLNISSTAYPAIKYSYPVHQFNETFITSDMISDIYEITVENNTGVRFYTDTYFLGPGNNDIVIEV